MLIALVIVYIVTFIQLGKPAADFDRGLSGATLRMRAFGTCALWMLTVILSIEMLGIAALVVAHVALEHFQDSMNPVFGALFFASALLVAGLHLGAYLKERRVNSSQVEWIKACRPQDIEDKRAAIGRHSFRILLFQLLQSCAGAIAQKSRKPKILRRRLKKRSPLMGLH